MSQRVTTRQILSLFWSHAWAHKPYVIGLMVVMPAVRLFHNALPPLIIAGVLDKISNHDFTSGDPWGSFGNDLLLYAALVILGGVIFWRVAILLIWKLEMSVLRDIHQRIFNHLMRQSSSFHANRFGGSLVSQANKLGGAYVRLVDTIVFQNSGLLFSFVYTLIILGPRSPFAVLLLFSFSVLFMVIAVKATKQIRDLNAKEAAASNRQTGYLADAVTNVMAIKSFAGSWFEKKRFAGVTDETYAATDNVMRASIKRDILFSSTTSSISIVALIAAVVSVVSFNADIATVYLIVTYTGVITQELWTFSQSTLRNYNRAIGDAQEMTYILSLSPEVRDPKQPEKIRMHRGSVKFNDVKFGFSDASGELLFDGLNLSIKPGEKIGLVGHSGGGKTTITKLLMRFMDIQDGNITIDGQDITRVTQDDLRSVIAYVPQEPLLFHRSLFENISYGAPGASRRQVEAIAKLAHAHEFIESLPNGYNTLVGERGVKLSGGQRQRVAIARAMIKNAPILLLDEATSALDSESEALIQEALWRLMEGRTAIVIAHRLSTIQKMDRILVMDKGKIAEQGTHKELIRQNGIYAGLWERQSGGFIEE